MVPELEALIQTMLYLRGDGDGLPSMHHFGRDALRKFMYKCIFDSEDGNSKFSHEPGLIDVAGRRIARQNLHEEIVHFLEDQLDVMMASPHRGDENSGHEIHDSGTHNVNTEGHRNLYDLNRMGTGSISEADLDQSSIPSIANLNLGAPQRVGNVMHEVNSPLAWNASKPAENPYVRDQLHLQGNFPTGPSHGQGHSGPLSPYGQPAMNVQQQRYPSIQQHEPFRQFVGPPGVAAGSTYFPPMASSLAFYPGRQIMPQGSPITPYGPQYFANPGFGMPHGFGPMVPPHFMPNPQMALNALPPHLSSWGPQPVQGIQPNAPCWPQAPSRAHRPSSRSASPLTSGMQSRAGRHVVSHVPLLPYRPGSDDMYPHATAEGSSVQLQQLERHGGPNYDTASKPENIPFVESARQAKPAEWGVLKIGNVSGVMKLINVIAGRLFWLLSSHKQCRQLRQGV